MDYGLVNIGVSVSDENRIYSFPLTILKNNDSLINNITTLFQKHSCCAAIIGMPKNLDGSSKDSFANEIIHFANTLSKHLDTIILLWDERMTTSGAISQSYSLAFTNSRASFRSHQGCKQHREYKRVKSSNKHYAKNQLNEFRSAKKHIKHVLAQDDKYAASLILESALSCLSIVN